MIEYFEIHLLNFTLLLFTQNYTIATTAKLAIDVAARLPIINPIAVADVEARLGAIPPDRMMDEPRKRLRKPGIEPPRINTLRHRLYNVGTAASLVAGCTIRMIGLESF
jgi:hypothetical protein